MAVPTITPLPAPPIRGTDTGPVFSSKTAAFLDALHDVFQPELNQFALELVYAAAAAGYSSASTTSLTIGTGAKSLIVESGKMFAPGQFVTVASASNPTVNYMFGQIQLYDRATGAMTVNVTEIGNGAIGTHTDWFIGLSGAQGNPGDTLPAINPAVASKYLRVNPGGNGTLWDSLVYETLIGTLNPSSAADATFTGDFSAFRNLRMVFNLTSGGGSTTVVASTYDGSSWTPDSGNFVVGSWATIEGQQLYFGRANDAGPLIRGSLGASLSGGVQAWSSVGGIDGVRITSTGTFSGTVSLYGQY